MTKIRISFLNQAGRILGVALLVVPAAAPAAALSPSPAQRQIDAARATIQSRPADLKGYNSLAVGLTRRARETGDTAYYEEAWKALELARHLDPNNRQTLRISAWVSMGQHEFARAYAISEQYDRQYPGDSWNQSVMGDALMELGRYDEAEKAFQRMVDLKPGTAAYSRVAYVRELRGDLNGALEIMRMALTSTESRESEDRAWLWVQIAHLQDISGDLDAADASYRSALAEFSGYHYALAGLAELTLRRGDAEEATRLAQQALSAAPHAERYLILADTLRTLGKEQEARAAEETFERLALQNVNKADNENHDLVLFYLERRPHPQWALSIAKIESSRRRDVHSLDRLAIALAANGEERQARRLMKRVLEIGTHDPLILRHAAGMGLRPAF